MSLDVGDVLREGAERTMTRAGGLLMVAFAAVGLGSLVARHSYAARVVEVATMPAWYDQMLPANPTPLAVDVSVVGALGLWFATGWAMEILRILSIRVMGSDPTGRLRVTDLTRRLGWVVVNGFLATLVVKILVGIGLVLVVPAVFLAVSFLLVRQVVALEDADFVEALSRSWSLASGERWRLLLLAVVYGIGWVGVQFASAVVRTALESVPALAVALVPVVSAPLLVFGVAVGTRAYVQLSGGEPDEASTDEEEEEWPDPPGLDI